MLPFGVLFQIIPRYLISTGLPQVEQLVAVGVQELARRAIPGVFIVPCCLLLSLLSSSFCHDYPASCLVFVTLMVASACCRGIGIYLLLIRHDCSLAWRLRLFALGCLLMALTWGAWAAVIIGHYQEGFSVLLVFVLSSGIGAGIVANFSIWRNLALAVLLFAFMPPVISTVFLVRDNHWVLIVALLFFLVYIYFQVNRWYEAYWNALANAHRCEQQATVLANLNRQLSSMVERELEARKEVEAERQKMHELFDHSLDGILICTRKALVVEVNSTFVRLAGVERATLLGTQVRSLFQFAADDSLMNHWQIADGGQEVNCETKLCCANHRLLPVHINLRRVRWQSEDVIFMAVSDISKQKEAQELLALTQKAFVSSEGYRQKVLPNIELPIFSKDPSGHYLTVNDAFLQLCGVSHELVIGKTDGEIFSPTTAAFFKSGDGEIVASGLTMDFEGTLDLADGCSDLWLHKFALYDDDHRIFGIGGICTDRITIKKALQTARKTHEAEAEFLANMSHELRTPLHSLISFGRLGRRKAVNGSREKLESYFAMIVNNGERFLELLNNFLTLTTLEAEHGCYQFEKNLLAEDLRAVAAEFKAAAEERNLKVRLQFPGENISVHYDRTKLFQVIRNLLANAIKFSKDNSEIVVAVQKDQLSTGASVHRAWKIMVIDQGVGIDRDELDVVFGKFVQGRQNVGNGGVGLGLALCKRIVEDHGGIIWAESNEFGGTTFAFLLPQPEEI